LYKVSGLAAILAGVILVVAIPLTILVVGDFVYLFGLVTLLLAVALPGLQARQALACGRLGLIGFVAAMIGAVLLTGRLAFGGIAKILFDSSLVSSRYLDVLAGSVLFIGITLLGAATVRADMFPRWATVMYALGPWLSLALPVILLWALEQRALEQCKWEC